MDNKKREMSPVVMAQLNRLKVLFALDTAKYATREEIHLIIDVFHDGMTQGQLAEALQTLHRDEQITKHYAAGIFVYRIKEG